MSATDRIREDIDRVVYLGGRTVEVRVDEVQALCDVADAARDAIDHYEHCVACGDHTDNCRCDMSDVRAALAPLEDKEEDDGQ